MSVIKQGLSTGAPDLTPILSILVQRLQAIMPFEASSSSSAASDGAHASHHRSEQLDMQARARELLALVSAVDEEVYL